MNKSLFTEEQKKIVIDTYPSEGSAGCVVKLGWPQEHAEKVRRWCVKNKIHVSSECRGKMVSASAKKKRLSRTDSDYRVPPSTFIEVNSPEAAYILGLLWADGYIIGNSVRLEVQKVKVEYFVRSIKKTGNWAASERRRPNKKAQMLINTNNERIANHLRKFGYGPRAYVSACEILKTIPQDLIRYWFRGIVDGDGCFYVRDRDCCQFSIAGSFEQDWIFVERVFNSLGIKGAIARRQQVQHGKTTKNSVIRLSSRKDIAIFGKWLYQGFELDEIGLPRKHAKWKQISDLNDDPRKPGPRPQASL